MHSLGPSVKGGTEESKSDFFTLSQNREPVHRLRMHCFMRKLRNDRKYEYCITVPRTFVHDCSYSHEWLRKINVLTVRSQNDKEQRTGKKAVLYFMYLIISRLDVDGLLDSSGSVLSGRNMSIIPIVDKIRLLSIIVDTNQSTNIGNR